MSDLVVAAFLLSSALLLMDDTRLSPWLAGAAVGLAMDVKLSAPFAIPLLFAIGWFARPRTQRTKRVAALAAGAVLGAFWYVVNIIETGAWDGHVSSEFNVDRSPAAIVARILRIGIEFIDLSGATGRDRWLYGVAALIALFVAAVGFLRSRRRTALFAGGIAALIAFIPALLLPFEHLLIRAYFKSWDLLGRRDLANLDSGRDITKSASNFSWYGPLGSLLLVTAAVMAIIAVRRGRLDRLAVACVIAPAYWLVVFAGVLFYQDWVGRFFAFPVALTAATWGLVWRWRPSRGA